MSEKFVKKSSKFFLGLFIGLIIFSFAFTGYNSLEKTPDTIAKVDGVPIKLREYEMALKNQLSLYRNITGGKDLTETEIKRFRIKETALNNLINKKLWHKIGEELSIHVADDKVIDEVKKVPYFLTNKKFDFNRYKLFLAYNEMTTKYYESMVKDDLMVFATRRLVAPYPLSKGYVEKIRHFKEQKIKIHGVEISRKNLAKQVKVTPKEITAYLQNKGNLARVKRLSPKDDQHQRVLAQGIIQNSPAKDGELKKIWQKLSKQLEQLLARNKLNKIKSLKKVYQLNFEQGVLVSLFDGSEGKISLDDEMVRTIFKDDKKVHLFQEPSRFLLVKTLSEKVPPAKKPSPEKMAEEYEKMQNSLGAKYSQALITHYRNDTSVKIFQKLY